MTTNLFVIANVKQLQTQVVLEFYCIFSEYTGVLASQIQQFLTVFTNWVEFGMILEGLRNFGGGGLNNPNPPSVRHWQNIKYFLHKVQLHVSALDNGHLQVVHVILIKRLYKKQTWAVYMGQGGGKVGTRSRICHKVWAVWVT